ncbi:uncharacterized protein LOC105240533 [Ailuropoda melanoleuca]|uniref:uncharacterized protein LOC105240533 n=1 Tax=Ailuropoda melanoleuca TaxID=9646 RepID=UPI0014943975|nr:uncharacterized protein LOC105240533 [Ailuropoda melanoleuca]XP_011231471.2 uncharacterized protein LOC105240533 [Ailuropoda melanoleuca]
MGTELEMTPGPTGPLRSPHEMNTQAALLSVVSLADLKHACSPSFLTSLSASRGHPPAEGSARFIHLACTLHAKNHTTRPTHICGPHNVTCQETFSSPFPDEGSVTQGNEEPFQGPLTGSKGTCRPSIHLAQPIPRHLPEPYGAQILFRGKGSGRTGAQVSTGEWHRQLQRPCGNSEASCPQPREQAWKTPLGSPEVAAPTHSSTSAEAPSQAPSGSQTPTPWERTAFSAPLPPSKVHVNVLEFSPASSYTGKGILGMRRDTTQTTTILLIKSSPYKCHLSHRDCQLAHTPVTLLNSQTEVAGAEEAPRG